jgi:hypothetical protein
MNLRRFIDYLGWLNRSLTRPFRRWIDHIANLGNLGGGKAADLRVPADDGLICGEINAKRLIVRDVAFEPLDIRPELSQHPIRLCCRSAELFALEGAHLWNIAFDDKLAQCHISFSLLTASGHATAAPPSSVMNSRRPMQNVI